VRRTPLVGLLVFSVLGFSGCAGASRRLDWSSPSTASADADETSTASRFSWWRLPRAEAKMTDSAGDLAQDNSAGPPAASTKVPGDVWPEPRSDWSERYFPHLSRLLKGNAAGNSPEADPFSDMVRVSSRWRPPAAPHAGRADDDVRPADASSDDDIAARGGTAVAETRERFVPPLVPTPLLVRSVPHSVPERKSDVELDISNVDPGLKGENRSRELQTPGNPLEPALSSVTATTVPVIAPGDDSRIVAPAETSVATAPGSQSASIVNPEPEMVLAQGPAPSAPNTQPPPTIPPAPPLNRTPPPPPLTDGEKPKAKPDQPEAPTAPKVADEPKPDQTQETTPQPAPTSPPAEVPPTSASPAPAVPPSPAAVPAAAPQTQARSPAAGQRLVAASGQAIYASPPPMAPPRPRSKFLSLFFVEEKTVPLASPQFPPAMFPAAYYGPNPRPYPVLAAPQANNPKPPVAIRSPKKPCVLTAWFQRITNGGHGTCCAGCHHASPTPCCSGCTCYSGKNKSAGGIPQKSLASPQGDLPSRQGPVSQTVPSGSTGPKPGDVTEEGKLFERVSFEGFDKSPQS
jgi:hypothetical protein